MAYNKIREERKWRQWKEKEERLLRILGMDEDSIQELRSDDWKEFNSERRFREHQIVFPEDMELEDPNPHEQEVTKIQDLLNEVSDEKIFLILLDADRRTLQILLLKVMGFSIKEISERIRIPEKTIYTKIDRLKKKIKIFSKK